MSKLKTSAPILVAELIARATPNSTSSCRHCKTKESYTGTRGGCSNCGRVKATANGKRYR